VYESESSFAGVDYADERPLETSHERAKEKGPKEVNRFKQTIKFNDLTHAITDAVCTGPGKR